jgi:hypothetical protein
MILVRRRMTSVTPDDAWLKGAAGHLRWSPEPGRTRPDS